MINYLKLVGIFIAVFILAGIIGFITQGTDFFMFKFWAPKYEQARRETFEQSKAYNEGMAQELEKMMLDYKKSKSEDEKQALKSVILHRSADFDINSPSVSYQLRNFIQSLKEN